jgi:hypothetical protein
MMLSVHRCHIAAAKRKHSISICSVIWKITSLLLLWVQNYRQTENGVARYQAAATCQYKTNIPGRSFK